MIEPEIVTPATVRRIFREMMGERRALRGTVTGLEPLRVHLDGAGAMFPSDVDEGLELALDDRVLAAVDRAGYIIVGRVRDQADPPVGGAAHVDSDHDDRFALLEHDTAHDDRFSQLGHIHTGLAVIHRGSDQSIATDTEVTWSAGVELRNDIGLSHTGGGVHQFTTGGVYLIHAHIVWAGTSGGYRRAWILVNNDPKIVDHSFAHANVNITCEPMLLRNANAGDNIRINVRQSSGVSLAVVGGTGTSFTSHLYVAKLA